MRIYVLTLFFHFILSFSFLKQKKRTANFTVASVEEIYINKSSKIENGTDKSTFLK